MLRSQFTLAKDSTQKAVSNLHHRHLMKAYHQCEDGFWQSEVMMQAAQGFFVLESAYLDRRDIPVGLVNVIYPFQQLLEYLGQIE